MKATLRDWHDNTITAMKERRASILHEIKSLQKQVDDLTVVIDALKSVHIRKGYKKRKAKGAVVKGPTHWSRRPGADPKRVEAWKRRMSKVQKDRAKVRKGQE